MTDLKICRICLQTEVKMYKLDQYQLINYYEEVMGLKMKKKDGIPHYFCYECATLLHKFHEFKERCYRGLSTFKELLWKGSITYERIYKLNRMQLKLTSQLGVLKVSRKVKTFTTGSAFLDTDEEESSESDDEQKKDRIAKVKQANTFPVCNEPVIYVETLNTENYEKTMCNYTESNTDTNTTKLDSNEEVLSKDKIKIVEMEIQAPTSPTTIFIDDTSKIVELPSEPVKEAKETTIVIAEPTKRYKFSKRTRFLDASHWRKIVLTEEEAVHQFRAKATDSKYEAFTYKCEDCFKGFSKEDMLKRHRLLRHNESLPLECRFCRTRYKWNAQVRRHMRQHFTKYECLRCRLVCPLESTALLHDDYHKGVKKKCIHCSEEFTHLSTFYTHLRTHRSDFLCPICGASFVSPAGLQQHKKIKHVDDEIESPDDDAPVSTYCVKCDVRFETRRAYDEHLFHSANHAEGVEEELKDEFSIPRKILGKKEKAKVTNELKSLRNQSNKSTETSSFKFTRKQARRKRPKKPTDCHQCGKHFDTQSACMKHHLAEHPRTSFYPSSERHICEICGASLAPGSVATHTNMHTKERTYACDTCGRAFHALISLKRHMLTHTGERPFGCSLCDKKFTQSNSMKLHYRTYHLKEPYPKRIRRKKEPPQTETAESSKPCESDESLPPHHGQMHYLTLT